MINYCHDCNTKEGELHSEGCDMERCPVCKRQLLSCPKHNWGDFEKNEREPYFKHGHSCARCGKFIPAMFIISDKGWEKICGASYNKEDVLCKSCILFIKKKRKKDVRKKI